jgi:hypothetical protein
VAALLLLVSMGKHNIFCFFRSLGRFGTNELTGCGPRRKKGLDN